MRFLLAGGLCAALGMGLLTQRAFADNKPNYQVAATWKLAGDGGWDYLTVDSKAHRLYIARGTRIQVVNTESGELVGEVGGISGAHGVALDRDDHRAYATSGRSNSVIVFDTQTLQPVGDPITVGEKPDAILWEPTTKRVWAFDAGSNAVSIIDPQTAKVVQTVELGGNPEFGVADGAGHVWVNVESTSEVVELGVVDGTILRRTSLAPGDGPTGLAYDAKDGLLFSGCANKTMVVVDATTGKVLTTLPVGEGVDAAAYDSTRGLAFTPNGRDGTLSVVGLDGGNLTVLNTIPTHGGARTMALDSETGDIFVVGADYEAPQALQAGQRPRRPQMVAGSTVVMKLAPVPTP